MRLQGLVARGFRNLADLDRDLPAAGVAILGANGQGKTNLLEALYYPVLFRSFRGATDADVGGFGGPGFHVEVRAADRVVTATYSAGPRRKRIAIGGEEIRRVARAIGSCLAVAFLPVDVGLAGGPAAERRRYLDRVLSLADPRYLTALGRYRAALAQRNGALRQGRPNLARAFDRVLSDAGAVVTERRLAWTAGAAARFPAELACLGEREQVSIGYRGCADLADPAAWAPALAAAEPRDGARGATTVGPQRDDLVLEVGGRPLRDVGSTGQQRTAAIALKLLEADTLARAHGTEPALLLDDVFAELDRERQERLARRLGLGGERQVFVTAPRRDELPPGMELELWSISAGTVSGRSGSSRVAADGATSAGMAARSVVE
ncbi:MAG TPA: DNA replication and repair protein RecF [Gemmatimonadales bacterium]|nr:DNA replication and repair protein RecF [Gemmatimonadales bacterium]